MLRRVESLERPPEAGLPSLVELLPLMEAARSERRVVSVLLARVGRDAVNELRLDSPRVPLLMSRCHAVMEWDERVGVTVTDLGSTNGTYVNGRCLVPMEDHVLADGDTLSFGGPERVQRDGRPVPNPFVFTFEARPPPARREPLAGQPPNLADARRAIVRALGEVMQRGAVRVAVARAVAGAEVTAGRVEVKAAS